MSTVPFDLVCCVVDCGLGSKALRIAKQHGVRGGTICIGRGTVKNRLLEFLALDEVQKEVVFMIADAPFSTGVMDSLSHQMAFHKPGHGITFSFPLLNFVGTKHCEYVKNQTEKAVEGTMYQAIFVVVDKGLAEDVVDAAKAAGARGGTILGARGSSIHDTDTVFAMPIEPEKEMVMILVASGIVDAVSQAICQHLKIEEPGNGVLFVLGVKEAYGLY